ncbi:hypothetical protein GCM10027416_11340 [Okibacterium endophyticum]
MNANTTTPLRGPLGLPERCHHLDTPWWAPRRNPLATHRVRRVSGCCGRVKYYDAHCDAHPNRTSSRGRCICGGYDHDFFVPREVPAAEVAAWIEEHRHDDDERLAEADAWYGELDADVLDHIAHRESMSDWALARGAVREAAERIRYSLAGSVDRLQGRIADALGPEENKHIIIKERSHDHR